MNITTFENLNKWFKSNSRKSQPAPYWTLYGLSYGAKDQIIARNDRIDDIEESWRMLEETIRMVNNPQGQRFRVYQVDTPGGNSPVGQVFIQIYETDTAPVAGIGNLPALGYVAKSEVEHMLAEERKKWEMEARINALEEQLSAPTNWVDKAAEIFERIARSPAGSALIARLAGVPAPINPMAGAPAPGDDEPGEDDNRFYDNMASVAQTVGVNEYQLAQKLKKFVTENPDMAKNLFQTL